MTSEDMLDVETQLLERLVCPVTKGPLTYNAKNNELISQKARLAFPVRYGIPIMLVDEARDLSDQELIKVYIRDS